MTRKALEDRRLAAQPDILGGWRGALQDCNAKYGVSRMTATRWQRRLAAKEAIYWRRRLPGVDRDSTPIETEALKIVLGDPAGHWSLGAKHWTARILRDVIKTEFGVLYDVDHTYRLAQRLGFQVGIPRRHSKPIYLNEQEHAIR